MSPRADRKKIFGTYEDYAKATLVTKPRRSKPLPVRWNDAVPAVYQRSRTACDEWQESALQRVLSVSPHSHPGKWGQRGTCATTRRLSASGLPSGVAARHAVGDRLRIQDLRQVRSGERSIAAARPSAPPSSVSQMREARSGIECSPPTASVTIKVKAYAPQAIS
jgi:hypothetical protein